jgi:hypothetical protein
MAERVGMVCVKYFGVSMSCSFLRFQSYASNINFTSVLSSCFKAQGVSGCVALCALEYSDSAVTLNFYPCSIVSRV